MSELQKMFAVQSIHRSYDYYAGLTGVATTFEKAVLIATIDADQPILAPVWNEKMHHHEMFIPNYGIHYIITEIDVDASQRIDRYPYETLHPLPAGTFIECGGKNAGDYNGFKGHIVMSGLRGYFVQSEDKKQYAWIYYDMLKDYVEK